MYHIGHSLVVSVSVNGGHNSLFNTECIVESLCHGRKAVGRTACVGYTFDLAGQFLVVDAQDYCSIDIILCGNAEHNLAGTGLEVVCVATLW